VSIFQPKLRSEKFDNNNNNNNNNNNKEKEEEEKKQGTFTVVKRR